MTPKIKTVQPKNSNIVRTENVNQFSGRDMHENIKADLTRRF